MFRTTAFNSIRTLAARLTYFFAFVVGRNVVVPAAGLAAAGEVYDAVASGTNLLRRSDSADGDDGMAMVEESYPEIGAPGSEACADTAPADIPINPLRNRLDRRLNEGWRSSLGRIGSN